ncbi:MAG TPA: HYR domain-containing protein, partial [Blastocatellia bacterium]|nr:HYR domain-containing protein [Blastocatellia bacterium]
MKAQERVFREKCVRPRAGLIRRLAGLSCFGSRQVLLALVLSAAVALIPSRPSAVRAVTCTTNPVVVTNNIDGEQGSLRWAISNACAGDTITFDLTKVSSPIALTTADTTDQSSALVINKTLTIQGPGANLLTVEANNNTGLPFRIFTISSGVTVTISGLTVTNGFTPAGVSGSPGGHGGFGGGIYNSGTLTLTGMTVSGNRTGQGGAIDGVGGHGGGIYNDQSATLTVTNSTISGNSTGNGGVGAGEQAEHGPGGSGGGIYNAQSATLTVTNSTISGNSTSDGGFGGGIYNNQNATLTVTNSTVTGNTAGAFGGQGGGIQAFAGCTLKASIIAGNSADGTGPDVNGTVTSEGFNVIGKTDGSSGWLSTGVNKDQLGTSAAPLDPKLGPLQNNGGPTQTHALLAKSPAIDAGDDHVLGAPLNLMYDQRGPGFPRKYCQHVCVGAVEFTTPMVNAPANITINTDPGLCSADVTFPVSATDACGNVLTPTCELDGTTITSPYPFPVGTTTVTCSATDGSGFTGTSSFTVTVIDTNAPVLTCPPIVANSFPGQCSASVPFFVSAIDACDPSITPTCKIGNMTITSGYTFPVGTTTVNCSATNSHGLMGMCSFNVTVIDTNAPVVTCPANVAVYSDPGKSTALVAFPGASATDVCNGPLAPVYKIGTTVITSPYNFPPGVTTVTASATNSHALTGMCSFTVTVTLLDICIQDGSSGDTFR